MPGHSGESAAHRVLGRAFGKIGHERAPAYPGDKKDSNLGKEPLDPLEEHEREMRQFEAKKNQAAEKKSPRRKTRKKKAPSPRTSTFRRKGHC